MGSVILVTMSWPLVTKFGVHGAHWRCNDGAPFKGYRRSVEASKCGILALPHPAVRSTGAAVEALGGLALVDR